MAGVLLTAVSAIAGIALLAVLHKVFSGWGELEPHYTRAGAFAGRSFGWSRARLGSVHVLRYPITLGVSDQGLCLWALFLFRFNHRPICIPWHDITATERKTALFTKVELRFRLAPGVVLSMRRGELNNLIEWEDDMATRSLLKRLVPNGAPR